MRPSVQIAYNTDRFDETVAFWTQTLSLKFQRGWDDEASRGALIELNEITVVEVFAAPVGGEPLSPPAPGSFDVMVQVDDIDHWHARLTAQGISVEGPLIKPHHHQLILHDPNGVAVWLYKYPEPAAGI